MKWANNNNEILDHISSLEQSFLNPIQACSEIISYLNAILSNYRENLERHGFENSKDEIKFFKTIKPTPLSYLIQFKKQLKFEVEHKNNMPMCNLEIIKSEIRLAQNFISKHQDFLLYMEADSNYLDNIYFLRRDKLSNDHFIYANHNHDSRFSTVYDSLWAELMATNSYIKYLNSKITHSDSHKSHTKFKTINWTGSKVALTELAIALKYSGSLNNGNISFKNTILFFQELFDTDLGEFHHTAMRLKNRSHPTKFMDSLKDSVEDWIEKSDE